MDASDYAGSISGGDSDTQHVEHNATQFRDDEPNAEFFDAVGDEALEGPEYVLPDDVLVMTPRRRRRHSRRKRNGRSTTGKGQVIVLEKWSVIPPPD